MKFVALALVALLFVPTFASATGPQAPVAVNALAVDPVAAIVTWVPSASSPATEYNVYGVENGVLTLLASTLGTTAVVPAGYQEYAVTAVVDGVESQPAFTSPPCIEFDIGPPPTYEVDPDCGSNAYLGVTIPKP